jgi:riboflavin biosynthesis pyrimidine reductase
VVADDPASGHDHDPADQTRYASIHSAPSGAGSGNGRSRIDRRCRSRPREQTATIFSPSVRSSLVREYAEIWRDADKVVYSSSLTDVSTARTAIERQFEPEAVRQLKEPSGSDLSIGGAGIAAEAFRHGLVDECVLLLCPVHVGGGKPALPRGVRFSLGLLTTDDSTTA